MKLHNTKVSIVVPCFNASSSLPLCIESIVNQTYSDLEVIIIDDNSSDDTYKVANLLKKCDPRIKVYKNKKRYGIATCLNRTVRFARGRYITFMNPTDTIARNKIKKQVEFLENNGKFVAVGTQCLLKNGNGRIQKTSLPTDHEQIYKNFINGSAMCFESGLINRLRIPNDIIKFRTNSYPIIFSSLYIKLIDYGKVANINQYLYKKKIHSTTHYSKLTLRKKAKSYMGLFAESMHALDIHKSVSIFRRPLITPLTKYIS